MNLYRLLQKRAAAGRPVSVGLVGAGKFGTMFLAQAQNLLITLDEYSKQKILFYRL